MSAEQECRGLIRALYTGRKRAVRINGREEPTAFGGALRDGPVRLERSGISGNELGTARRLGDENHAVYLFPAAHYAYFEAVLGRPIPQGAFSENIVYDGPGETALRIGDRLRIGEAVVEIVSPRVPCYKLAHFLETDSGFPSRFSASGRTGAYARVIEPGPAWAGGALEVFHTDARNATLAELNAVLTAARPGPDVIARVMASPALLPAVRQVIEERLAVLSLDGAVAAQKVRIVERVQETPDVISLTFEMTLASDEMPKPGQFVTLGITEDDGSRHFRCYSLTDGPFRGRDGRACRISVKRDGEGEKGFSVSSWLHDRVEAGAECLVYPPGGDFCLPESPSGPLAFIAGGIGITPILAQLRALAEAAYADRVSLSYIARTSEDLAFLQELSAIAASLERFDLRVFVTGEPAGASEKSSAVQRGRPVFEDEIAALDDTAHFFVCGPPGMIQRVRAVHAALGRPNEQLHFELFSDDPTQDASVNAAASAQITLSPQAICAPWRKGDGSLLAWIERHTGHRPPAACRSGICRTCAAPLLRGQVVYPSTVAPPAPTEVLLCCAMPASDIEIGLSDSLLDKAAE